MTKKQLKQWRKTMRVSRQLGLYSNRPVGKRNQKNKQRLHKDIVGKLHPTSLEGILKANNLLPTVWKH